MKQKVEYDLDGNAYVDVQGSAEVEALKAEVETLKSQLYETVHANVNREHSNAVMDSVVSTDPAFVQAKGVYNTAREWLDQQVRAYQDMYGVNGALHAGEVLDLFAGTPVEREFHEKFGEVDMAAIVNGNDSKYQYEQALRSIADRPAHIKRKD
jgi:hypothetical protein